MPEDQMPEYFEKGRSVIERYCESLAAAYDNEFGVGQIGIHTVERKSDKVIRVYVDLGEKRAGLVLFEVTPEGKVLSSLLKRLWSTAQKIASLKTAGTGRDRT